MIKHIMADFAKATGIAACGAVMAASANATVLTFDQNNQNPGVPLNQTYGDNVTGISDAAGNYGQGAEGTTPNVQASYLVSVNSDPRFWTTGYSDLTGVYYNEIDSRTPLEMTLTADAGFKVLLYGFDLGSFSGALVLPFVQVFDETNTALFSQANVALPASTSPHVSFDFGAPLMGTSLRISIDLTGLGGASDNVGMDNVTFGQTTVSNVPVPGAIAMLGSAAAAGIVAAYRRRQPA